MNMNTIIMMTKTAQAMEKKNKLTKKISKQLSVKQVLTETLLFKQWNNTAMLLKLLPLYKQANNDTSHYSIII